LCHKRADPGNRGGWYSSPIIKGIAETQKRPAFTVETSPFVAEALKYTESDYYKIEYMEGFSFTDLGHFSGREDQVYYYIDIQTCFLERLIAAYGNQWSVVFVDNSPGFLRRSAIKFFADKTEYMVVHDTEAIQHYGYLEAFSCYKYLAHNKWFVPFTSVMSNQHEVEPFCKTISISCDWILNRMIETRALSR
jgi:hypothetical protein